MNVKLSDLMRDNDYVGKVVGVNFGNNPNRNKIDQVLANNGYTLPLASKVSFHMYDGNKMFIVTWFPDLDEYGYEKLTMKG